MQDTATWCWSMNLSEKLPISINISVFVLNLIQKLSVDKLSGLDAVTQH